MNYRLFKFGLDFLDNNYPKWNLSSKFYSVVTAADSNVFPGLLSLFYSLKNKIPFVCYDIGLSDEEKKYCSSIGIRLKDIEFPQVLKKLKNWQFYLKPWIIEDSDSLYTLWIDTDCVVTGDLSQADLIKNKQTFFVKTCLSSKHLKTNNAKLYEKYPVANLDLPSINSGVFGINKKDIEWFVVSKWQYLIRKSIEEGFTDLLVYQDEGALNWSLQETNASYLITHDWSYNKQTCYNTNFIYEEKLLDHVINPLRVPRCITSSSFFKTLLSVATENEIKIAHFSTGAGFIENKYWQQWKS